MKKNLLFAALFAAAIGGHAQGLFDIGLMYDTPLRDFRQANYKDGFGMYLGGWSPEILPGNGINLQVGGKMDFSWNGQRNQNVIIDPGIGADYTLTNWHFGGHVGARLTAPRHARLRPYLDGYLGGRFFGTNINLTIDDRWNAANGTVIFSEWPERNWAISYGAGLGAQYWLNPCVALDLRGVFLTTPEPVTFANLNTVAYQNEGYEYSTGISRGQVGYFQVGLTFRLSRACSDCSSDNDRYDRSRRIDTHPGNRVYPGPGPAPGFHPAPGFRPAPNYRPAPGRSIPRS